MLRGFEKAFERSLRNPLKGFEKAFERPLKAFKKRLEGLKIPVNNISKSLAKGLSNPFQTGTEKVAELTTECSCPVHGSTKIRIHRAQGHWLDGC